VVEGSNQVKLPKLFWIGGSNIYFINVFERIQTFIFHGTMDVGILSINLVKDRTT
jgi:hypothetical protein